MWSGLVISIFSINTWLLPYKEFAPNDPAWTISTLSFWYWLFPFIFPRLQRFTNKELAQGVVKYFWLSVGINILLFLGLGLFIPGGEKVFWMSNTLITVFTWILKYEYIHQNFFVIHFFLNRIQSIGWELHIHFLGDCQFS